MSRTQRDLSATAVSMHADARDHARVYQTAGNQYIYESPSPAQPAVTRTLPRATVAFTGREVELHRLVQAATERTDQDHVLAIHAIGGMPGVGKTALAVHAGRVLADRFPDGQLFLRLHAHTAGQPPVDPADALASLLVAIGVPARLVPTKTDDRAALWRDRLAGKRMLLILDDVASHDQVTPLLPGTPGCLVLITSRRRLAALDAAMPLALDTLHPEQAADLFIRLAARHPLAAPDTRAVAEVVRLCGYLPLAVRLLAGRLRHHPAWSVTDLVDDLVAAQDRLAQLQAEDVAVGAAFDMSYRNLPADRQRVFRHVGSHPGADIDAYAAAALADISVAQARRHLDALYNDHLLDEPTRGRYRMHDLVRDYTRTLARRDTTDRGQALERLFNYYERAVAVADQLINGGPPSADLFDLSTRPQAMTWMRAERANLVACVDYAFGEGEHLRVVQLALAMYNFLAATGPWDEAIRLQQAAATSAQRAGLRNEYASALIGIGIMRRLSGNYPEATKASQQAIEIFNDLGDKHGMARALLDLGIARYRTGDHTDATELLGHALGIFREVGDQWSEAYALNELGVVRRLMGDFPAASDLHTQALEIYRDLDDRRGEADALNELGVVRRRIGDYPSATDAQMQALGIYREFDSRPGQVAVLNELGSIRRLCGEYASAIAASEQALKIACDLGDRKGHAAALANLGAARCQAGNHPDGVDALNKALEIYQHLGGPEAEELAAEVAAVANIPTAPRRPTSAE